MDIIVKERLKNGIGINIGNNIIHFLFKKNSLIPKKNKFQYCIDIDTQKNHVLELYYGNNLIPKNNILFYKILLPTKININIFGELINNYCVITISSKLKTYDIIVIKLYKDTIKYLDVHLDYIQRMKIFYNLFICIENIKYKLRFMNINSNTKKNIENKLVNFYNHKDTYENLQLMTKINELKRKFNLNFNSSF